MMAAGAQGEKVDEDIYRVAGGDWQTVFVPLRQRPATLSANFTVESGSGQVRIALVTQEDFERVQNDPSRLPDSELLAVTPRGKSGEFMHHVGYRDEYLVLLDNRVDKAHPAVVRMRIAWDFPRVTKLPPERQFTVIAISFLAFFGVVTYSARKFLKATRG
jgi:hypothetical protein